MKKHAASHTASGILNRYNHSGEQPCYWNRHIPHNRAISFLQKNFYADPLGNMTEMLSAAYGNRELEIEER